MRRYEEKPASKKARVAYLAIAWLPVGLLLYGAWFFSVWAFLLVLIVAVPFSWDYYRHGGMFDSVDSASRMRRHLPGAWRNPRP